MVSHCYQRPEGARHIEEQESTDGCPLLGLISRDESPFLKYLNQLGAVQLNTVSFHSTSHILQATRMVWRLLLKIARILILISANITYESKSTAEL